MIPVNKESACCLEKLLPSQFITVNVLKIEADNSADKTCTEFRKDD